MSSAPIDPSGLTPEQAARVLRIDPLLRAAGWAVQDRKTANLTAASGVAVREYPLGKDAVDYLLYVDRKAIGTIEAKKKGTTLSSVEMQSRRYREGFMAIPDAARPNSWLWPQPLPFHYISTGDETVFESLLDPTPRPRQVFAFHQPEWLAQLATRDSIRQGVHLLAPLARTGLRNAQFEAISGLETSLRNDHPRALIEMTMGGGKTIAAIAASYRLLRQGGAHRILFLVDRRSLGKQAADEFDNWQTPDDGRKFGELYPVQRLTSNSINAAAKVVVTTIQRLYAMLRDDEGFDEGGEDVSGWVAADGPQLDVSYQPKVPIETFDNIFIDECHRSIYGRWGQVLGYFDAFQTGLSATPSRDTYGYFSTNVIGGEATPNVVSRYTHEQSVLDGVNVDFRVFRIRTEIGEQGSSIGAGEWVNVRDKTSRDERPELLDEDFDYDADKLNNAVVAVDQIRTVLRAFKVSLPTMFVGRTEVPKAVVFCRDDTHADDVLRLVREVFAEGSDFARKITYLSGNSQQAIQDFRTDPRFRIAVSVDQISTGTDIKPVECLLFLRNVKSRLLFEQMKGRGVRTIDPADLQAVTGDAVAKTHFVLVDAVGVTDSDQAWAAAPPLDRDPSVPLGKLLASLAQGVDNDELLKSIASRMTMLNVRLTDTERAGLVHQTGGKTLQDVARELVTATSPEQQLLHAQHAAAEQGIQLPDSPVDAAEQAQLDTALATARGALVAEATAVLQDAEVRAAILGIQKRSEQVIDRQSTDTVLSAEFVNADAARAVVETWEQFVATHHDEYVALAAYYSQPRHRRLTLRDVRELADAIALPPHNLTPDLLWAAYAALEKDRVSGSGRRTLADLVSIIRFTTKDQQALEPIADVVRLRYSMWQEEQRHAGRSFTPEQQRWLDMVADQIASSLSMEREDFDDDPFRRHGGLIAAARAFTAPELNALVADLNAKLVEA